MLDPHVEPRVDRAADELVRDHEDERAGDDCGDRRHKGKARRHARAELLCPVVLDELGDHHQHVDEQRSRHGGVHIQQRLKIPLKEPRARSDGGRADQKEHDDAADQRNGVAQPVRCFFHGTQAPLVRRRSASAAPGRSPSRFRDSSPNCRRSRPAGALAAL